MLGAKQKDEEEDDVEHYLPEVFSIDFLVDSTVYILMRKELEYQWKIVCIEKELCKILEHKYIC